MMMMMKVVMMMMTVVMIYVTRTHTDAKSEYRKVFKSLQYSKQPFVVRNTHRFVIFVPI